jgi:hypothetical protein
MLLGYQPTESLVISCLHGDRAALGLTLRFDLDTLDPVGEAADEVAARATVAGADTVLLAVYSEQAVVGGKLPYVDLIGELFEHPDLWVSDALLVQHDRWWSYLCAGDGCCPPEGVAIEGPRTAELTTLEASLVLSGSSVLADRASLVSSLATESSAATPTQRRRVTRARSRVAAMTVEHRRVELARLVDRLTARLQDPRGVVTDAESASLAALCEDIGARDDLLLQAASAQRRAQVLALLRVVLRRIPPPHDAPICTVLAWFAYATGDGTLANIALDRALGSDPYYSLAQLIESGLDRQLPPSVIEEVVNGAAQDIAARDAAG